MTFFQALVLSLIQGITEFLPISSSGHLILIPKFLGWPDQGLAFDAIVHLGTAAAVIIYYRQIILDLVKGVVKKDPSSIKLTSWILISMIPATILGLTIKDFLEAGGRNVALVAFSLFAWGAMLIIAERYAMKHESKKDLKQIGGRNAFLIGCAQALALIPGTSRSGITLTASYFLNISRQDAVAFSFLMGVPVILGAGGLSFLDLLGSGEPIAYMPLMVALLGSFLSGLVAIHILRLVVSKKGLYYFGIYRIVLALILLKLFV